MMSTNRPVLAAVAGLAFLAAGCGGSSLDDLAAERFGDGAGSCKPAASTPIGKVYSCQTGSGTTVCVTREGDTLFVVTETQAAEYRISC